MLARPWGRRGELAAASLSNRPERFEKLREVYLFDGTRDGERFEVESVWEHGGRLIFKFRGIDSITEAERLRGAEVRIPESERGDAPEGEYYQSDLIGCEVVDRAGERLGSVSGFQEYGGPLLLEIEREGGPLLIPFARAICIEIDVANRRILVDLPEGLKEL